MNMGAHNALGRQLLTVCTWGLLLAAAGCSAFIPSGPSGPPTEAPVINASDGTASDRIVVSWGAVSGATSYKIYIADSADGTYSLHATAGAVRSWEDTGLAIGVHRWYRVEACNSKGCGPRSAADEGYTKAVPPGVPTNVSATDGTAVDKITVSWKPVTAATSYHIYRADAAAGAYELRASSPSSPWKDDGLAGGVHHWYRVAACNAGGCSAQSTADEGRTSLTAPQAPAWVMAEDGVHPDRIGVTWSDVPSATSYDIYRATSYAGKYTRLTSVTGATSYDNAGLGPDTHFWYKVAACNSAGCSALSTTNEGSTAPQVPTAPARPDATDGLYATKIELTWTPVPTATSYNIYRATPPDTTFGYRASVLGGGVGAWNDWDVDSGTTYQYQIRACNGVGCSELSPVEAGSTSP